MIEQTIIVLCGVSSIWLSQSPDFDSRKWAPIIGLVAQPFWMYACWIAEQYGIFALAVVYTAGWIRGIRTYWGTA